MYSLMSIRIIASCESNMNSASARASSVLPTPVGPRNRNVPIGRLGSCSPARERRSAVATASTASSWPTTRSCRRSSMWISFSTSPSSRRETGMPVQRATTSATSSASTSSLRKIGAAFPRLTGIRSTVARGLAVAAEPIVFRPCSCSAVRVRQAAFELWDLAVAAARAARCKFAFALGTLGLHTQPAPGVP